MFLTHSYSFLQSVQSIDRERALLTSVLSKIDRFAERDFSGVAGEIGPDASPTFPQDQFWDSCKSDEKSVTHLDGGEGTDHCL